MTLARERLENNLAHLSGQILRDGDSDYDEARRLRNALIDACPHVIVRARDASDVIRAVNFARDAGLDLAVRSGGHSFAGHSMVDDAVVIDLSQMKDIRIDPSRGIAWVQPGVTSRELADRSEPQGLVLSTGDVPSVAIGGLTVGGGIGYIVRKNGLTIDHLLSAEVVTADGRLLIASESENPDLFWAIRGGGGNFGIVTRYEFQLKPDAGIYGGLLVLPASRDAFKRYLDYAAGAPDELTTIGWISKLPPAPFIPEEKVGSVAMLLFIAYAGDPVEGEKVVAPLRALGEPIADLVQPAPYSFMLDLGEEGAMRNSIAARSMFTNSVPDDLIDASLEFAAKSNAPLGMVQYRPLGGAMSRFDQAATAFAHRDKAFMVSIVAEWETGVDGEEHNALMLESWEHMSGFGAGVYVNFLLDEGDDRIREAYPPETYARLARIKHKYDPTNLFRFNQNIKPQA